MGSLSWNVDDKMLFDEFQGCGDLLSGRVITDRETGRSRGFGYVDFASADAAEKAFNEKQGGFLDGREMKLDFSNRTQKTDGSPAASRAKKFGDTISPESDTLFVGNLSFQADEDTVTAFFSDVAPVKSLRIPTDP